MNKVTKSIAFIIVSIFVSFGIGYLVYIGKLI